MQVTPKSATLILDKEWHKRSIKNKRSLDLWIYRSLAVHINKSGKTLPDNCVREQVKPDTPKVAPEHIHWLEEYWVERCCKKYYYWRYCWMEGPKILLSHIGSVRSEKANLKKQAVESAILDGQSAQEIKQLI